MIRCRTATQCGQADFGWLKARYTFSFGHYFDPAFMNFASLRVLNQEVLAAGSALQPRTYPRVDVLNLVLQGEAEYRDSDGHHARAAAGQALLLSARPGVSYSEHNIGCTPLTRMQLWLDACPLRENATFVSWTPPCGSPALLASPDGEGGSLQLRQQAWIYQITLEPGAAQSLELRGNRAYIQSIHGQVRIAGEQGAPGALACGDGAFIDAEQRLTLHAVSDLRALVIDLAGESDTGRPD